MKTILLYGFLGERFGKVHQYAVNSPAEAIRALSATINGFKQALIEGEHYRVVVGGRATLDIGQTINPISDRESIRIVPVVAGSGGLGKVLLGAALIAASFYLPGSAAFLGTTFNVASMASSVGFSLVLGGVSQMLFAPPKAPKTAEAPESRLSFIFNGAVNTSRQGNCVPVCYGRMIVGSQVISAGLSVTQL